MLFTLLVSLLGSIIAIRMFENLVSKNFLAPHELTKIGTVYVVAVLLFASVFPRSHLSTWVIVFAPILILGFLLYALILRRKREFRDGVNETLTLVSLKMKAGRSFRQSLGEVIAETHPHMRVKLTEIADAVVFSQQNRRRFADPFVDELIEELKRIDQHPHLSLKRLSSFRDKLRIESEFRRRSGQVLARIRAQSLLMSGLYLAIAVLISWNFGFQKNAQLFVFSLSLFIAGAVWIWLGGKKIKWKV